MMNSSYPDTVSAAGPRGPAGFGGKRLVADLALFCSSLVWGLSFPVTKILLVAYPPYWLLSLRFFAGSGLLLLCFRRRILGAARRDLFGGAVIGLTLFTGMAFQTVALGYVDAGRGAFLTSTYVLLVPLLLWAFRGVFPGWLTLGAACVCLLGTALLTTDLSGPLNRGDVLTLVSTIFFAAQIIAISRYAVGGDPFVLTFMQFLVTALLSLPAALFLHGPLVPTSAGLPQLAFTILFCTFVCYLVQNFAQKFTLPSHAAIIMSLESVSGLAGGILFLGEAVTLRMAAGCLLIFSSVLLAELEPFLKKGGAKA